VGTRESQLARLQTDIVVNRLRVKHPDREFVIVPVTTHGDKVQDRPIADLGTRGVFVKELEKALLAGEVDLVVHSLKDLPTDLPDDLLLAAVLDRADPRDVLVSHDQVRLQDLPSGSRVATSSRRRIAQLKSIRQDLEYVDMRGNIQTRLRKHDEKQCEAMVLAAAGLIRLGLSDRITEFLPVESSTPAVGQGALAVECRTDDHGVCQMLHEIEDVEVRLHTQAERALLDQLGGGCSVPIGALAISPTSGLLRITGCVAELDGSKILRASVEGEIGRAHELGMQLAEKLRAMGAEDILVKLRQSIPNAISAP
jgi:hydroxymethylbilane synthase